MSRFPFSLHFQVLGENRAFGWNSWRNDDVLVQRDHPWCVKEYRDMFPGQSAQFLSPKTSQYHLYSVGRRIKAPKGGGIDCLHQAVSLVQEAVSLVTGGPPGTRRSAWECRADNYIYFKSRFSSYSFILYDRQNPRACSGFLDLLFILHIGFEHQGRDSDIDWSLLARYFVSLRIHRRLTTSVVTLYLILSQIFIYRFLCFPSCLSLLNSLSLWVAKYLVGDSMWLHS